METVFLFNCGRYAHKDGADRIAPDTVEYPIFGWGDDRHKIIRKETVRLSAWDKEQWLKGYDNSVKAVAAAALPKAKLTWLRRSA